MPRHRKQRQMSVYLVTNLINGKRYVGKTECGIAERWKRHLWASQNRPSFMPISAAIAKYGADQFSVVELADSDNRDDLIEMEKQFISLFESRNPRLGYNCTGGGEGVVGLVRSAQHLAKLAECARERWANPEWKAKTIAKMRGKPLSDDHKNSISETLKKKYALGQVHLNPRRGRRPWMSDAMMARWKNPEFRQKQIKSHIGHRVSEETRVKLRNRVDLRSDEYRNKMSASISDMWKRRKERALCQQDKTGNSI